MAINNVTLNNGIQNITATKVSTADNETKNLQNQLANKEQRLQRLSSDSELTAEEKAKERQEIQQQIAELNRKLKLMEMEQKEKAEEAAKKQEQKVALNEELYGKAEEKEPVDKAQSEEEKPWLQEQQKEKQAPIQNLQQILAADSYMQQERVQSSVDNRKSGQENVLVAEIQSDALYGIDNQSKKEELSEMRREKNLLIEEQEQQKQAAAPMAGAKIIIKE